MKSPRAANAVPSFGILLMMVALMPGSLRAQTSSQSSRAVEPPIVLTVEGTNVWIQRHRSNAWSAAYPRQRLNVRDRGRTGADSRTSIRLSDLSVLRIGWHSEFEIQPLPSPEVDAEFSLSRGLMRLLNRDRPGRHRFVTPTATAATRGTEFVLKVDEGSGRTTLTVFAGLATMTNGLGAVELNPGEQGIAEAGQPPRKTAVIDATAIVQWCLYYPGVLDLDDLSLTANETAALAASLSDYRSGDVLRALSSYPPNRTPTSDSERIFLAALLLAAGQVERSETILATLEQNAFESWSQRLAPALKVVINAVSGRPTGSAARSSTTATELLAESYAHQARFELEPALEAARRSVRQSPQFAFGWARVAELEFSFGRIKPALAALDKSLAPAPRNAQAVALRGFMLSAQNNLREAQSWFERAIELDGGLGNAWLGKGLCQIRRGRREEGRFDLQVAAAMEPQRSLLRSYLGKAFNDTADYARAGKEFSIGKNLDDMDPTAWLYSALLMHDLNRVNESVCNLERSQELNDNRRVFRSRLLLDQDRAVRGANLARVYRDAGMTEVSVREAGRAVNADYANYSAHRFLADSYNELRDINQINLRYETAWFTEYLLANLLAPVGAGPLSQSVSQHEYSKLFQRDGFGITSATEYLSHGEWVQNTAQFGTFGDSSYAAEFFYHSDAGHRPNNDLEQLAAVVNLKQQLTPQDSVYLRLSYSENEYGDVNHYYRDSDANPGLRFTDDYAPSVLAGYHREWSPGHHTLLLAGRMEETLEVRNPTQSTLLLDRGFTGVIGAVTPLLYEQHYRSKFELYTAELQQIAQVGDHSFVFGGRFQSGDFKTRNAQFNGRLFNGLPFDVPITNQVAPSMERRSVYLYDHWQLVPSLLFAGGITYDWLSYPGNYRYAPLIEKERESEHLLPKAGLIWTPTATTTFRGAWLRSVGGVSIDQSVRLEPSQIAGFNQVFRSVVPESVAGANSAPEFETWGASIEQKIGRRTFVGVFGELASSAVERTIGVVSLSTFTGLIPASTREKLDFEERSLGITFNQLIGDEWSVGARYRVSQAELNRAFPEIPTSAITAGGLETRQDLEAVIYQAELFALFHHASGFFAGASATWTGQHNRGYSPGRPGDTFWQFNVEAGYRFPRRRAELRLGLLNLTDEDYRLNPLNLTQDLPRERTIAVSVVLNF
ncbi:MAG TPA: FecR domain-containing protein [Verrucomicrobiae bacterium]|nr:FecR domain-containing protein [Verrucomicrobiae bacterium]